MGQLPTPSSSNTRTHQFDARKCAQEIGRTCVEGDGKSKGRILNHNRKRHLSPDGHSSRVFLRTHIGCGNRKIRDTVSRRDRNSPSLVDTSSSVVHKFATSRGWIGHTRTSRNRNKAGGSNSTKVPHSNMQSGRRIRPVHNQSNNHSCNNNDRLPWIAALPRKSRELPTQRRYKVAFRLPLCELLKSDAHPAEIQAPANLCVSLYSIEPLGCNGFYAIAADFFNCTDYTATPFTNVEETGPRVLRQSTGASSQLNLCYFVD